MNTLIKIVRLLSPAQRWSILLLFVLMLIGMVLETLGVGAVIPAIGAMGGALSAVALPSWVPFAAELSLLSKEQLIVFALSGLVALFAIKASFLAFLVWRQANFMYDAQADLSQRLFAGYLGQPYAFHLRRNSSQLIRNVMTETNAFTLGALQAGMLLSTEGLVAVGLGVLLLFIEPVGAISVIVVIGLAGFVFLRMTRSRLKRWGEMRQFHEGQRIQHLQEGLGGAKDVKLLGREAHFLAQYGGHNAAVARMGKREMVVQALPRLWLELLAVAGLALLVLVLLAQRKPLDSMVPTLGVFAAAAYRLVPSANRILNGIQGLRYYLPVVDTLTNEFNQFAPATATDGSRRKPLETAVEFRNVSYRYPDTAAEVVSGIDLTIPARTSVGIVGESGAGKSTLIDLLMGLLTPTAGGIIVDGHNIQENLRNWQDQFGYVAQTIFLTDDTLRRNIAFGVPAAEVNDDQVWEAVRAAQLDSFVVSLPEGLDTMVGERGIRLSGGQRQRIGIARALYQDPSVLVLDEATSSLDTQTEQEVMRGVKLLRDKTIVIVAHRFSTVEHCDVILRIEKGVVVARGTPGEILPTLNAVTDLGSAEDIAQS